MMKIKTVAAGVAVAGTVGLAALGVGAGVANAAPSPVASGTAWAQDAGWDHGPGGHRGGPGWDRPGWAPPPPDYGYGYGYGYGAPVGACVQGPLGLLHVCV